jgi:hypothetical protein
VPHTPASPKLSYLTDLEGRFDRLRSFATGNPHVALDGAGRLVVAPGAVFVFGGDAVDRGPEARRVVATLVEAKQRQPDQVVLIAGNRDLNKLRLVRELDGEPPPRTPEDLRRGARAPLLTWIFLHTMGAKDAFAHRRSELAAAGSAADDTAVVDSFLADLAPDGAHTAYLAAAQLAYRAGGTLFVHGGLGKESLGHVPGRRTAPGAPAAKGGAPDGELDVDLDTWVAELNAWYHEQVDAFVHRRSSADAAAWQALVAYQAPLPGARQNPTSVVYGRSADEHNNLHLPAATVRRALRRSGVSRLVIGHTPSGDSPSILRSDAFTLVCADNSHARHDQASRVHIEGDELVIDAYTDLDGSEGTSEASGTRLLHAVRLRLPTEASAQALAPIGRRLGPGGPLVRGRLPNGAWLTYLALPGWQNQQHALADAALDPALLEAPE